MGHKSPLPNIMCGLHLKTTRLPPPPPPPPQPCSNATRKPAWRCSTNSTMFSSPSTPSTYPSHLRAGWALGTTITRAMTSPPAQRGTGRRHFFRGPHQNGTNCLKRLWRPSPWIALSPTGLTSPKQARHFTLSIDSAVFEYPANNSSSAGTCPSSLNRAGSRGNISNFGVSYGSKYTIFCSISQDGDNTFKIWRLISSAHKLQNYQRRCQAWSLLWVTGASVVK